MCTIKMSKTVKGYVYWNQGIFTKKLRPRNFVMEEDVHEKDQSNDQSMIQW